MLTAAKTGFRARKTGDGSTRQSPNCSKWGERISIARHALSGGLLDRAMSGLKSGLAQLDAGTKTIHAAYKDLRRRDRFSADFRPTPYDVWPFRHDQAFGIPHPGAIPPGIVAHALYYFTPPGGLVVDPMAGGGTTADVCQSMGRRCLAYDLHPTRPDIQPHDVRMGLSTRGVRLRPDLLRPSLSHDACPEVCRRWYRQCTTFRMGFIPPSAGSPCVRDPTTWWLPGSFY